MTESPPTDSRQTHRACVEKVKEAGEDDCVSLGIWYFKKIDTSVFIVCSFSMSLISHYYHQSWHINLPLTSCLASINPVKDLEQFHLDEVLDVCLWHLLNESSFAQMSENIRSEMPFFCNTPNKTILIWLYFPIHSSRGSSKACGGRGPKLNSTEGDVAFPDTRQTARSDPWLPGSLCTGGKWRIKGPSPHQGCHVSWCAGMTIPQFLSCKPAMLGKN